MNKFNKQTFLTERCHFVTYLRDDPRISSFNWPSIEGLSMVGWVTLVVFFYSTRSNQGMYLPVLF